MDVRLPDGTLVRNVPEGTTRAQLMARLGNPAAQTDAAGAGAYGFGDMATFGLLDEAGAVVDTLGLTPGRNNIWNSLRQKKLSDLVSGAPTSLKEIYSDNIKKNRVMLKENQRNHPVATTVGQVAGAIAAPIPGAGIIKGVAKGAGKVAPFVRAGLEGATQGALYGAGSGEGDAGARVSNAGKQALAGAIGGTVGTGVAKGFGRALAPVKSKAVQKLAAAGITMTPGQRGGPIRRWAENVGESIPGLNIGIRSAQRRGVEQFNKVWTNEALEPIGKAVPDSVKAGHDTIGWAQQAVEAAFDEALNPMSLSPDDAFTAGKAAVAGRAAKLPPAQAQSFDYILNSEVAPLIPTEGPIPGRVLQQVKRLLDKRASSAGRDPAGGEMLADNLGALRDEYLGLASRAAPDEAGAYMRANDAYANMARVNDAASRGTDGVFSPKQALQAARRKGYGTTTNRVARGDARMQDLANDAASVLPSTVPNSGTPERAAALALLSGGAGATVNPLLAIPAAATVPYLPGVDRVAQSIALDRPEIVRRAGEELRRRAYLGGLLGTPLAIQAASVNN